MFLKELNVWVFKRLDCADNIDDGFAFVKYAKLIFDSYRK